MLDSHSLQIECDGEIYNLGYMDGVDRPIVSRQGSRAFYFFEEIESFSLEDFNDPEDAADKAKYLNELNNYYYGYKFVIDKFKKLKAFI